MLTSPPSDLLRRYYSLSCDQLWNVARDQLQLFVHRHPEATPEVVLSYAQLIIEDLTPGPQETQQLLELALQDQELIRFPLATTMGAVLVDPAVASLADLLRAAFVGQLIQLLLAEIGLHTCSDCGEPFHPDNEGGETDDDS